MGVKKTLINTMANSSVTMRGEIGSLAPTADASQIQQTSINSV